MKRFFDPAAGTALVSSAAIALVMLFPGVEVYLKNRDYFSLSPFGALVWAALAFLIFFAAGSAVLFPLRNTRAFDSVHACCWGLTVSFLLQYLCWSDFFPAGIAEMLPPRELLFFAGLHLVLLLAPPVGAVLLRRGIRRNAKKIAAAVVLTQIVSVVSVFCESRSQKYDFTEYSLSEKTKFEFGKRGNVIFLVIDAMGERLCKEAFAEYPELRKSFADFVCFDRIVSPIPRTMYAVPAMLTGIEFPEKYDGSDKGHAEYVQRACRSETSLFTALKKDGFRCEGYPLILQTISYSPDVIDNSVPVTSAVEKQSAVQIVDSVLERQIPFFARPLVEKYYYIATDHFVTPRDPELDSDGEPFDTAFMHRLEKEFRVGPREKVFKYFHLFGVHSPIRTNERLEPDPETTRLRQLRGALSIVEKLIAELKAAGLYASSVIVITGDHTELYRPETITFIKRRNARGGRLVFNSVPCSVRDLAGTVIREILPAEKIGSLFDAPPVPGDGSCREKGPGENLRFGDWKKIAPANTDEFTLYTNSFSLEKGRLVVEPESEASVKGARLSLLVLDTKTGECRESVLERPFRERVFWESAVLDLPDGVYQVFVRKFFEDEAGRTDLQILPRFLVISGKCRALKKEYPVSAPEFLRPGDEIVFRPMRPYPQFDFGRGMILRDDGVVLEDQLHFDVRVASCEAPVQLTLRVKCPALPQGTLTLFADDVPAAELAAEGPREFAFSALLKPGEARVVRLRFTFAPLRGRRERMPCRMRIHLGSLRLSEISSSRGGKK